MFINLNKPIHLSKMQLFKASPKIRFNINRAICLSHPHDNDSYTFVIPGPEKNKITSIENQIRKMLPKNTFLNSPLKNGIITCKIPKVKGQIQTQKINSIYNEDSNSQKYAYIELFIDNIYSFNNNRNNYFYKIKVDSIEFIS